MCKRGADPTLPVLVHRALAGSHPAAPGDAAPPPVPAHSGSRRRRIWELGPHAQCPVIGVCLPLTVLRKLVHKVMQRASGGQAVADDDYELHCSAVADCRHRSAVAEAVQRELDRRYALAVQQAGRLRSTEALAQWWNEALQRNDIAGALWAVLTHPRCTPALAQRVEGQVHMLQHQVGMAARVDKDRFDTLLDDHAALTRELAAAQLRSTRQAEEHTRRREMLQGLVMQLRAQLMTKDSAIDALQAELQGLESAVPGLKGRFELARELERLMAQCHDQQRALLQARREAERAQRRSDELVGLLQQREAAVATEPDDIDAGAGELHAALRERSVLCVGGRPASVPVYRQLIEGTGGRFLHHDGGEEDSAARLDATLAAADIVICQTGCISHDAYWRVKDHCKRTGKRCVFVESPSGAGLKRALLTLVPAAADAEPGAG